MFSHIEEVERRLNTLEHELSRPEVIQQQSLYQKYLKEHVSLLPIVDTFRKYKLIKEKIKDTQSLLNDPDPFAGRNLRRTDGLSDTVDEYLGRRSLECAEASVPHDLYDFHCRNPAFFGRVGDLVRAHRMNIDTGRSIMNPGYDLCISFGIEIRVNPG